MKRLKTILAAMLGLSFPQHSPQVVVLTDSPEWTAEDAAHWKTFLGNPTGQKLLKKARALQVATCINACEGKHEPKFASGFTFAVNWFERLATISESPSVTGETFEDSHHDDADTLALEPSFS